MSLLVTGNRTQPVAGRCVPGYLQLQPCVSHPWTYHYCNNTLVTKYHLYLCAASQLVLLTLCRPEWWAWIDSQREQQLRAHTTSTTAFCDSLSSCSNIAGKIGKAVLSETAQPLGWFQAVRAGNFGKEFKSSFSNVRQQIGNTAGEVVTYLRHRTGQQGRWTLLLWTLPCNTFMLQGNIKESWARYLIAPWCSHCCFGRSVQKHLEIIGAFRWKQSTGCSDHLLGERRRIFQ